MEIIRTPEDLAVKHLVVAVHGIGSQFRYSTVQSVERRFAEFCKNPVTQPLGAFHPVKLIKRPDSPELGAYLFTPPAPYADTFGNFGFAEVFWADIPERAADTKNTTEECKAWAQTLVERVHALDESNKDQKSNLIDYNKTSAVVAEMIDTIRVLENLLFIAKKAGLFEFNLGQLLTDFLGDVQIVADFKDYGGDIFRRFANTMTNLNDRLSNLESIHIVAHSEGTVVSLKCLLTALAAPQGDKNEWIDKVKGYMTIGSPLNKHIVMWPALWKGIIPSPDREGRGDPILWRNYYDYGDPVGFNLEITRDWLIENKWLPKDPKQKGARFFQFRNIDDFGFTRYPFPGKAHNDYWNDPAVFEHFINEVVLRKSAKKPPTIWWAWINSWIVSYLLCMALLAGGTYVLYKALTAVLGIEESTWTMMGNVTGITCLIAGITLLSRMPRLDKVWPGGMIGVAAFTAGVFGYLKFACDRTHVDLSFPFSPWLSPSASLKDAPFQDHWVIWVGLAMAVISASLSKFKPKLGMIPLISLGGIAAASILWNLIKAGSMVHPAVTHVSLWPLVLANAAFLYLWWLSALIFDLVFVWHRFIRLSGATKTLHTLCNETPRNLRA
ncbi:MAG: hypothetical protein WCD79_22475 [Chthoniobacteraceae bacterium]